MPAEEHKRVYEFYWHLYVGENNERYVEDVGMQPHYHNHTMHPRYGGTIKPFLEGQNIVCIFPSLACYNHDFWADKNVAGAIMAGPPKPKPDFKLLKFGKPQEEEELTEE
jgi:hypothetical protein